MFLYQEIKVRSDGRNRMKQLEYSPAVHALVRPVELQAGDDRQPLSRVRFRSPSGLAYVFCGLVRHGAIQA